MVNSFRLQTPQPLSWSNRMVKDSVYLAVTKIAVGFMTKFTVPGGSKSCVLYSAFFFFFFFFFFLVNLGLLK